MRHKRVGNQFYRGRLGSHAMKIESTVVDWKFMLWKLNLQW